MRYTATINLPGHRFPDSGEVNWKNLLMLANEGTDPEPEQITERLITTANRIESALRSGVTICTRTATISPVAD